MRQRTLLIGAALVGLVMGPALDQLHVRTGALAYEHPDWLDQPWWVAPQFAIAFLVIAAGAMQVLRRNNGASARPGALRTSWTVVAFVAAYAITGIGHEHESLVASVLATALGVRLLLERADRAALGVLVLLAIGGSAYEWALSTIPGTFDYAIASLGAIPTWLPLLYAHAALAAVAVLRQALPPETTEPARPKIR